MEDPKVFAADAEALRVTTSLLRGLTEPDAALEPRAMQRPRPAGARGPRTRQAVPRPPVRSRRR
jgi:hypothetical protein